MSTEAERRFRGVLFLTRDDSSHIQAIKLVVDGGTIGALMDAPRIQECTTNGRLVSESSTLVPELRPRRNASASTVLIDPLSKIRGTILSLPKTSTEKRSSKPPIVDGKTLIW